MTTRISTNNLDTSVTTLISAAAPPKISNVSVTNNSYSTLDDTAVDTAGGYIKITGTNFAAGCQVLVNNSPATSVTFVNSTEVRAQIPAQSAGTYTLYVVNSDGGVAIRVNGVNYSGVPAWSTASTLTQSQVDSAISIQLAASSNSAVVYALQAGSTLPAGVSLTANGLISGTVTGITSETTYNFTVVATDAELQDTARAFSITITANDTSWPYVSTLLSAATPAVAPFATDASTNNFAVSVFGDTRPNNFGPYTPGYYSNYFDGSGDKLTLSPNVAFAYGTGAFTVEAWVYQSAFGDDIVFGQNAFGINYFMVGVNSSGLPFITYGTGGGGTGVNASTAITLNAWNHVAWVREGTGSNQFKFYVNGILAGTNTVAQDFSDASSYPPCVGGYAHDAVLDYFGYISNLRVVKGTAVYTANFTPSTTPLTAIANTTLLTCQSNRFIDNSTNNFTVTRNGDTLVSGFDPFLPNSAYSTYGSTYFDGASDSLRLASNAISAFPGDFTFECWTYLLSTAGNPVIYLVNASAALIVYVVSGKVVVRSYGTADLITSVDNIQINVWTHIAVARSGTTMSLWLNGSRASGGTITYSTAFPQGEIRIATNENDAQSVTGYITDLRLIKGSAFYNPSSASITVPTVPLTAVADTVLLTCQSNQPTNNSMFVDSSTNNFLITRNGNTTQGAFTPYAGTWSNYFDGTGDYLTVPYSASLVQWWNTDYTIEMWIYNRTNAAHPLPLQVAHGLPAASDTYWAFGTNASGNLYWYYWNGSQITNAVSASTVSLNTWTHVAMVYNNTTGIIKGYINGVEAFSVAKSGTPQANSGQTLNIGKVQNVDYTGYISNLRIVRGTMVYTGAFTPPTAPLTPITNTSLLTCADNRFVDDSMNNFAITRNGDTGIQKFSPFAPQLAQTPTSYSVYFDGTGDYLQAGTNSNLALGSGNFTIEGWHYCTGYNGGGGLYSTINTYPSSTGLLFYIDNIGRYTIDVNGTILQPAETAVLNAWVHWAVVRNGSTLSIYINGTSIGSVSSSTNFTDQYAVIGRTGAGTNSNLFLGYLSNTRMVKGTAVYTTNFTPPTAPLTAIANTSLLTCQSTTIIDNSTNNFAITVNGNSQPLAQNPFGYTNPASTAYTPGTYGGSAYFDGTGDYLNLTGSALGSGDFTIEMWTYMTSYPNAQNALYSNGTADSASATSTAIYINNTGTLAIYNYPNSITTTGTAPLNQWNHLAVVRNSGTIRLYINGVSSGSGANTNNISDTVVQIMRGFGGITNSPIGYVGDVRVARGQALYTSAFVPPAAPLAPVQNSVLLLNTNSAAIYDSSMVTTYETVGNAQISTSVKKYGTGSMYFDGTGDYLKTQTSVNLDMSGGNFTWEFWINPNSVGSSATILAQQAQDTTVQFSSILSDQLIVYDGTNRVIGAVSTSQWTHVAIVRNNGTLQGYINGTASGSSWTNTSSTRFTLSGGVIGARWDGTQALNGYIDDLRITRGAARYTANFTPSTSPVIAR